MSAYKTDDGGNILHFAVECASHFKGTWEATKDTSQCLKELLKKTKLVIDQPDNNGMLSKIITSLLLACCLRPIKIKDQFCYYFCLSTLIFIDQLSIPQYTCTWIYNHVYPILDSLHPKIWVACTGICILRPENQVLKLRQDCWLL